MKLDREKKNEYDIPIMATDGGGKSTFTTVKVKVEDENDNPPIFIYNEYKKAIHLNQSLSKTVLQVNYYQIKKLLTHGSSKFVGLKSIFLHQYT